jgi:hypothetical protein
MEMQVIGLRFGEHVGEHTREPWDRFGKFAASMEKTVASVGTDRMPEIFLPLVCGRLFAKNRHFLQRVRAEGGSLSLVATIPGGPQCAFKLTPELARQVSELGITIDFEFGGE